MKRITILLLSISVSICALAQTRNAEQAASYRRSSLYNILLSHPQQKFSNDVRDVYYQSPFPDKFNNHSLSILSLTSTEEKKFEDVEEITKFLNENHVGQRMVAKWFNRNKYDGTFDIDLLASRGLYNASQMDHEMTSILKRGSSLLEDAGAEMISNTFVVVYDIVYIDKEERAQNAKAVFSVIADVAGSLTGLGGFAGSIASLAESTADLASSISDMIAGFTVKVTSHLYQLEWNDEVANRFYTELYISRGEDNPEKKALWDTPQTAELFKLKYIDSNTERSAKTVTRGLYSPQDVIRKVINRSMDEALVALQDDNEVFRVKVPVLKVESGKLYAAIGMKEGVTSGATYEVLEPRLDDSGRTRYHKVGEVKAVSGKICDNRYMAEEEGASGSELDYTEFEIVSGRNIFPGMLLHEGSGNSLIDKSASIVPTVTKVQPVNVETKTEVETKTDVQVVRDTKVQVTEEVNEPKPGKEKAEKNLTQKKGSTLIMAVVGVDANNISNFSTDRLSFGIQAGWAKKVGFYGKFKTNFVFEDSDYIIYPDYGWSTGKSKVSYLTATAGLMIRVIPQMYFQVGGGYGRRTLLWQDTQNEWRWVSGYSKRGPVIDASALGRFGTFSISIGCSALIDDGVHLEPELGIGIMF